MRAGTNDMYGYEEIILNGLKTKKIHTVIVSAYAIAAPEWEHVFYAIKAPTPSSHSPRTALLAYPIP